MLKIRYHGHACFGLSGGKYEILIDPFITGNPLARVKAEELNPTHILVTHGHGDHLGDTLEIAKRTDALVIAPNELAKYCGMQGVKNHPMHIGGSYRFDFGRVKLTPAWHGSAVINDNEIIYTGTPCGFVVEIDGKYVYHAGDTGLFSDMKLISAAFSLDCALLPIGDNFVMGPEDAVLAAEMLQAKITVPMHYNTFPVIKQDPHSFIERLESKGLKGKVLEPEEYLEL